jgi:hypothetical protein
MSAGHEPGRGYRVRHRRMLRVTAAGAAASILIAAGSASATRPGGATPLWTRIYDGPAHARDTAYDVAASPDGSRVFVTGASFSENDGYDYETVAYEASGARLWAARFDGPTHQDDEARAVGVSPDGTTVFVTGFGFDGAARQIYTNAYHASTGAVEWQSSFGAALSWDSAFDLEASSDGSIVVVAGWTSRGSGTFPRTVALDQATGDLLWAKRRGPDGTFDEIVQDVVISPDASTVFVVGTGSTDFGNSTDGFAMAYDAATGHRRWVLVYDGHDHLRDGSLGIAVSPDGSMVYVATESESATTAFDYVTSAYDAVTGSPLWTNRWNGTSHDVDQPSAIEISPDGTTVLVTGRTHQTTPAFFDFGTVAIDAATGDRLWIKRYDHARVDDEARDIGVSADGTKTFVTGMSYNAAMGSPTRPRYATQVYDTTTGEKLGVWRYHSSCGGTAVPSGLAVGTDRIFVTGTRGCGQAFAGDYATVAYPIP